MSSADTHYITENINPEETENLLTVSVIQNSRQEELEDIVARLETYWSVKGTLTFEEPLRLSYKRFYSPHELDENGQPLHYEIKSLCEYYDSKKNLLAEIYHRANTLGIIDLEDNDDLKLSRRINSIFNQMEDLWQILFRTARMYERVNYASADNTEAGTDPNIFMPSVIKDIEELEVFQKVLIVILRELYENNIRKYKGYCCIQIRTPDGFNTRAWQQTEHIKDYVHRTAPKESRFDLWKELTSRGCTTINQIIKYLEDCHDMQFPEIKKNRHLWSFSNGLFYGRKWCAKTGLYKCEFYPYTSPQAQNLDPREVSSKYFPIEFDDYSHFENWYDIPTPYFDQVLRSQNFEEDVCKWMFVMIGRLCFDLNDLDHWQIIPFLKGIARSGKSTLITKVCKKFYSADDIRTLSNNIEKKFGLSSIHDGNMFVAPEIKGDLQLEQAEFQSIVSGEDVSIAVKGEKAKNMTWNIPGILGGNEVPSWKDNSGSIIRRLMTWDFKRQIKDKDADPQLENKLAAEIAIILQKCVRGYLEYSQKYQGDDIWNIVPQYFENIRKQVATVTNPLEAFLQSDDVVLNEDTGITHVCPMKDFKEKFRDYCNANNLGRPRFTQDFYIGPFSSRDIEVKRLTECMYRNEPKPRKNEDFLYGVDIKIQDIEISKDH